MSEPEKPSENPLDLNSLENFSLGTAWSPSETSSGPRRERSFGDRPQRRDDGRPPFRGGDRPDSRGPRREGTGRPPFRGGERSNEGRRDDRRDSRSSAPVFTPPSIKVVFYPEEGPFKALTKALKASHRTYELFEIARLLIEKADRSVAVICNKPAAEGQATAPLYQVAADGTVFLTEADALAQATTASLDKFFKSEEAEIEAPKGNFPVIHKCGFTGKLIAPPNYHRYGALLAEHAASVGKSVEAIAGRVESVKEPEAIAQWTESMKKVTRYTLLTPVEGRASTFDSVDAAKNYLATFHKAELVHALPQIRLSAKTIEALPAGEVRRSIDAARAMQTRFPLDTANSLRGRLRRMGFALYKRGPKGVSYLCAVKRKFRTVGQAFAPDVQQVIEFIEKTPLISDVELPKQMLGITPPAPVAPIKEALAEGEVAAAPVAPKSTMTAEEETAYRKLKATLQWLVEEGYVIYFGDGKLFVSPPRAPNAPKTEDEEDTAEVTPEAATEATAEATTETPAPEAPSAETPAPETKPEPDAPKA